MIYYLVGDIKIGCNLDLDMEEIIKGDNLYFNNKKCLSKKKEFGSILRTFSLLQIYKIIVSIHWYFTRRWDFYALSLLYIVQSKGSSFPIDGDWKLSGYNIENLSISINTVYHSLMESRFAQTSKLLTKKERKENRRN